MLIKQLSELHDAHIVGVAYLTGESIRLDFEEVDASKRSLLLTGVVHFFCTGMLEGNIVDSVEVIDTDDISGEDLKYFVDKEGRGQTAEALRRTITSKRLFMMLLSPSYGAELGCICSTIAPV